jgi:xanthine/uracil/vitamin C permease (AzgA family)
MLLNSPVASIFTVLMMMYRVRGAILLGILLVSIISWPRPTPVTYFPHDHLGDQRFDFFKKVVTFHPLQQIGNAIDVSGRFRSCEHHLLTLWCISTPTAKVASGTLLLHSFMLIYSVRSVHQVFNLRD